MIIAVVILLILFGLGMLILYTSGINGYIIYLLGISVFLIPYAVANIMKRIRNWDDKKTSRCFGILLVILALIFYTVMKMT